jgi:MFS family permease
MGTPPRQPVTASPQTPRVPPLAPTLAPSSFVALQHCNFRLLWAGQLVSFSGTMMQSAAILWHVSLLVPEDRKALALGMVGLVRIVPIVVFSLVSGVVADVLNRRKLMLATQTVMATFAGILALLTFRGLHAVWPIYLLAALGSAAPAFRRRAASNRPRSACTRPSKGCASCSRPT